MATNRLKVTLSNQDTGIALNAGQGFTSSFSEFVVKSIEVGTVEETLDLGDINTARAVALIVRADDTSKDDDLRVGLASGVYDQRATTQIPVVYALETTLNRETQTITAVADVSDSLDGTFVTLEGASGTWAIWIDTDDSGTAEPSHGMDSSVEVTGIATDATAAAVAAAINTALQASAAFLADFDVTYVAASTLVTITDRNAGTRTNLTDGAGGGATGFTLATTQAGADQPTIYLKSLGTSSVLVAIAPR